MESKFTHDDILRVLQYEGKENDKELMAQMDLGSRFAKAINDDDDPYIIIKTLTNFLSFTIANFAKDEESRQRIKTVVALTILGSSITMKEVHEREEDLRKKGVIK